VGLASGKGLVEIVAQFINGFKTSKDVENDKSLIVSLLGVALDIILEFKNREVYDTFSLNLIKAGVFSQLINAILDSAIQRPEFKDTARIFELCACHIEGIRVLAQNLTKIVFHCNRFM
jgi:hypothetical protein